MLSLKDLFRSGDGFTSHGSTNHLPILCRLLPLKGLPRFPVIELLLCFLFVYWILFGLSRLPVTVANEGL